MKYSQYYLVILTTLGVVGFGFAAGVPVVHQFNGGDPASASQVNQNFQELADRIAAIPGAQSFDYHNYSAASNIASKTFAYTGDLGGSVHTCASPGTETISYTHTPNGVNTNITKLRLRTDPSGICDEVEYTYIASPTELTVTSKTDYDGSHGLISTETFDDGLVIHTSDMRLGMTFGSSSSMTNSVNGGGIGTIDSSAVVAVEDLTVKGVSYTGCLKIHRLRTSNTDGSFNEMSWYCPNIGEVKRVRHAITNLGFKTWELTGYTTM